MIDTEQEQRVHDRRWWTLAVLCLSLLLIVAGNSSLNVALPPIQRALGSSQSQLQWMVDVYSLVFAGLLLPAGALADRFGRKWALQRRPRRVPAGVARRQHVERDVAADRLAAR